MLTHGLCTNILLDQGTNYQSELMKKVLELLDIKQVRTSPYHPETDGITERFNRTLKMMISSFVDENQKNWDVLLPFLAFAYNTAKHETTNCTPFELLYGRKPKIPLDLIIGDFQYAINREGECINTLNNAEEENEELGLIRVSRSNAINSSDSVVSTYLKKLKNTLAEAYNQIISSRDINIAKSKLYYERNIRPFSYKTGELVLKESRPLLKGFQRNWLRNGLGLLKS